MPLGPDPISSSEIFLPFGAATTVTHCFPKNSRVSGEENHSEFSAQSIVSTYSFCVFVNSQEQIWEEKVLDPIQSWGLEFVPSELQASSCRTMNGKGFSKKKKKRKFQLPGDSSGHLHLSTLSLPPLNGSPWCYTLDTGDSLENVNCCWVWGGNVALLYASHALSIVGNDVSYCDNHICSREPMSISIFLWENISYA